MTPRFLALLAALSRLSRRVVFGAVALGVAVPLLWSSKLRVSPSEETTAFHRMVSQVQEGQVVLLVTDVSSSSAFELRPMLIAVVRQVFSQHGRVVAVCVDPQGLPLVEEVLEEQARILAKEYGTDWAFLGYRPSSPGVIVSLATAPYTVFPRDYRNRPLSSLPLTSSLRGARDYALVVVVASGSAAQDWVIFGRDRYLAPLVVGLGGGVGPTFQSFVQTKAVAGLMAGLRGAAEYEVLVGHPGEASRALAAQSSAHLLLLLLVVLGNASWWASHWLRRAET